MGGVISFGADLHIMSQARLPYRGFYPSNSYGRYSWMITLITNR